MSFSNHYIFMYILPNLRRRVIFVESIYETKKTAIMTLMLTLEHKYPLRKSIKRKVISETFSNTQNLHHNIELRKQTTLGKDIWLICCIKRNSKIEKVILSNYAKRIFVCLILVLTCHLLHNLIFCDQLRSKARVQV